MFHEIPLKLYLIKFFERNISQCILAFKARIHCEMFLSKNFMRYLVSLCKLLRNAYDILFEAFHEIWKFWKLIFRIFSSWKTFLWVVINHALTHIHPHPPTPIHNQPKKGHTHLHPSITIHKKVTLTHNHLDQAKNITLTNFYPHPGKERSYPPTPTNTLPKKGHTHPHITERKNFTCLTHDI